MLTPRKGMRFRCGAGLRLNPKDSMNLFLALAQEEQPAGGSVPHTIAVCFGEALFPLCSFIET